MNFFETLCLCGHSRAAHQDGWNAFSQWCCACDSNDGDPGERRACGRFVEMPRNETLERTLLFAIEVSLAIEVATRLQRIRRFLEDRAPR